MYIYIYTHTVYVIHIKKLILFVDKYTFLTKQIKIIIRGAIENNTLRVLKINE